MCKLFAMVQDDLQGSVTYLRTHLPVPCSLYTLAIFVFLLFLPQSLCICHFHCLKCVFLRLPITYTLPSFLFLLNKNTNNIFFGDLTEHAANCFYLMINSLYLDFDLCLLGMKLYSSALSAPLESKLSEGRTSS